MPVLRLASAVLLSLVLVSLDAAAWERGSVQSFASLPPGAPNPEGIAADSQGNIYVTGFGPTTPQGATGPGYVFVLGQNGKLLRTLRPAISSNALLGIAVHPDGDLLVVDFGQSQVLRVDSRSGAASIFMTVPPPVPPAAHGLNDITLDRAGNVYVSDSFEGTLFVANTGNDTVVRIANDAARAATVFTHAINGADGLLIDEHDNVWVCANQADEIVVVDPSGKAIAKLGDFEGACGKARRWASCSPPAWCEWRAGFT